MPCLCLLTPDLHGLQCEMALAKYLGVRYAIGLNSGASAIFMALKCSGLEPGAPVLRTMMVP